MSRARISKAAQRAPILQRSLGGEDIQVDKRNRIAAYALHDVLARASAQSARPPASTHADKVRGPRHPVSVAERFPRQRG